jgi:dual specificity protein phosphatase-like protein
MNDTKSSGSVDWGRNVRVEEVRYYPDVFDFLLSLFPHTMTVKLSSDIPEHLKHEIDAWIEFRGPDSEVKIQMLPYREGSDYFLEGAFCPPKPGIYQFRIILSVGNRQVVVEEGERSIIESLPHERWTLGPVAIEIEEGLFLGNAAAAANPHFLEEHVRGKDERTQVAVVNATKERLTRPALLGAITKRRTRFVCKQFPFTDFSDNPIDKGELWNAVRWIHEQINNGPVLVHCHAGIGRSSSLIVAYLRLFRHPEISYDQVVERVKEVVIRKNHNIFPHVGLPETIKEFQEDEQCQKALAKLLGKNSYEYLAEPAGEIKSVSFANGYSVGQTQVLRQGDEIMIQARVAYEGSEPRGVFVHTNLNGENAEILMRRVAGNIYQAKAKATLNGQNFWLTASATVRRFDHPLKRKWIGGNIHFNVD